MTSFAIMGFVALGIIAFLGMTFVTMALWNWLVPSLFKGPRLRFVQALGLVFLTRLFIGFGGPGHVGGHAGPWMKHGKEHPAVTKEAPYCKPEEGIQKKSTTTEL
ncbi:hypothetical protein [Arsenicibacter rosenii]|uniref:Uncharacterized protein n=1 Tax=Arsenicibacter rosenii TaxID=1750698 RepID=A0A1S2VFN9_9BACT|nr:hypothetical protein [Arsenicibacter rosenii]OIN57105.1 hypothetical protein BLX24_21350 [Arsenicibacter rosenii]